MELPELELERIARVHVELDDALQVGPTARGVRRVVPITGGRIDGDRLRGEILPGGADWQLVHDDGSTTIDTRYTARTDDGALVYLATSGVRHGTADVLRRVAAGEAVDPREYYFRLGVRLESGDERYAWLTRTLFVASAARLVDAVAYDLYALA
ncbi:DUF3237 domain-containing protein [Saccharomonospora cyanea]|uniref:UPF0311 protein SaccyDRAFT_3673 n=1 Tax=Saccharomonospora cyanea NA-134 TaxID=882082 RepID=H5XEM1_9PSEU|nr:DUF3237 domain-containing protein [Saccharomonospora cyanea]EHR62500.1 Protein of unknown function (DUF3237) [Saccharomonospora cyanea NA-134]